MAPRSTGEVHGDLHAGQRRLVLGVEVGRVLHRQDRRPAFALQVRAAQIDFSL
jgi:hypothetical protein